MKSFLWLVLYPAVERLFVCIYCVGEQMFEQYICGSPVEICFPAFFCLCTQCIFFPFFQFFPFLREKYFYIQLSFSHWYECFSYSDS